MCECWVCKCVFSLQNTVYKYKFGLIFEVRFEVDLSNFVFMYVIGDPLHKLLKANNVGMSYCLIAALKKFK